MAKKKKEEKELIALDGKLTFILEDKRKEIPSPHAKAIIRETDNPIIFDNGYKASSNQMEIDEAPIADAMRYISKMTAGIATGVLSDDKDYIKLQRKFVDLMIRDKAKEVKNEVEKRLQKKRNRYSNIPSIQKKALDDMRECVAKVTEEHGVHIFIDHEGRCVAVNNPEDIEGMTAISGSWTKVTMRELKDIRDAKEKKRLEKKSKAKKVVTKKKVTKKKAKKNDRK